MLTKKDFLVLHDWCILVILQCKSRQAPITVYFRSEEIKHWIFSNHMPVQCSVKKLIAHFRVPKTRTLKMRAQC